MAHDLLVWAKNDPKEARTCPSCGNLFVGEQGIAYCTNYRNDPSEEWTLGYVIFCTYNCLLHKCPTEGQC